MKRIAVVSGLAALILTAPGGAKALTITLDNPLQTVSSPDNGTTTVDFTGTVRFDSLLFAVVLLDNPSNTANTLSLQATLNSAFSSAAQFGANYTGSLFSVAVPIGTPPDLYGFEAELKITEFSLGGATASESAHFSVDVTPGSSSVPEDGPTILLLALALATLYIASPLTGQAITRT